MDVEDLAVGEDVDSESQLVRWATDPAGREFLVQAAVPDPLADPLFEPAGDEGPVLRLVLQGVNRLFGGLQGRTERHRQGPPPAWVQVWDVGADPREELVLEERCSSMEEGRRLVTELVRAIRAGTFTPGPR